MPALAACQVSYFVIIPGVANPYVNITRGHRRYSETADAHMSAIMYSNSGWAPVPGPSWSSVQSLRCSCAPSRLAYATLSITEVTDVKTENIRWKDSTCHISTAQESIV